MQIIAKHLGMLLNRIYSMLPLRVLEAQCTLLSHKAAVLICVRLGSICKFCKSLVNLVGK